MGSSLEVSTLEADYQVSVLGNFSKGRKLDGYSICIYPSGLRVCSMERISGFSPRQTSQSKRTTRGGDFGFVPLIHKFIEPSLEGKG